MKKFVLFFLIVIMTSACEDILKETPKNFISAENFYKGEQDIEAALIGAYQTLWDNTWRNFVELHNDYSIASGSFASVGNFDQVLLSDTYKRLNELWNGHYTRINRANIVLAKAPQIQNLSENTLRRILAEAYFLRAYSYFDLLRYWGSVPLRVEEFSGASEISVPRAPLNEIYDLIIDDLTFAEEYLPESVGNTTGRASKWAAKILMAQVYLNMENWSKAAEKADDVIESNKFSLVTVNEPDDFYEIFATINSSEEIMSHHFSMDIRPTFMQWYHGIGTPYNRGVTWGFTNTPNMNSPFIINWDENDLRKDFNIYNSYIDDNGEIVYLSGVGSHRYKKYIKNPDGNALYSIPIYRLAEAFLIYAEAICMANDNPSTLALERLNIIKRRGYGYDPYSQSAIDYNSGMSKEEFIDAVIQERGYEYFLEIRRWWDLKRTGKAKELITEASGKSFNDYRLLFPIPIGEIENNPGINQGDQNPGY